MCSDFKQISLSIYTVYINLINKIVIYFMITVDLKLERRKKIEQE